MARAPFVYLDSIVHANPCSEKWEAMPGDDWTRFCDKCGQNVYNLSAMTVPEAEALLRRHEGKVCTKLYRRPDGSVLTQRCPSSIRRALLRVGRWAMAAGLAVPAFAQNGSWCGCSVAEVERGRSDERLATIRGVVKDNSHIYIPMSRISLRAGDGSVLAAETDEQGRFEIREIPAGSYEVKAESAGFESYRQEDLEVAEHEIVTVRFALAIGTMGGNAGLNNRIEV